MARKERVADRIIEAIEKTISEKELKPGDRISSENELCREFDVSRASVREAIRILEVTGKVDVRQGKGVFLNDDKQKLLQDLTDWLKQNKDEIIDHMEVRLLLEPYAASRVALKGDKVYIQHLRDICKDFDYYREQNLIDQAVQADLTFHQDISNFCHNKTLTILMKTLIDMMKEGWRVCLITPERAEKTSLEHIAIVDAMENKDEALVAELMRQHLRQAISDIVNYQ